MYSKEAIKIYDGVREYVNYFHEYIQDKEIDYKNKDIKYFLFFDNEYNPFIIMLHKKFEEKSKSNNKYSYYMFDINKIKVKDGKKINYEIGAIDVSILKDHGYINYLEISNTDSLRKGISSNLLDFFEYFAFLQHKEVVKGKMLAFKPDIITSSDLKNFYKYNGYNISKKTSKLTKNLNQYKQKIFAKNVSTIKMSEDIYFKVVFPQGMKQEVMDLFREKHKGNEKSKVLTASIISKETTI